MMGISTGMEDTNNQRSDTESVSSTLSQCKWRYFDKKENTEMQIGSGESNRTADVTLNLRQYIADNGLLFDKQGYDKNIHLLKVNTEDRRVQQAVEIADISTKLQVIILAIYIFLVINYNYNKLQ